MHSTPDGAELAELARDLRASIARHARAGAWSAPGTQGENPAQLPEQRRGSTDAPRPYTRLTLAEVRAELGDCKRCKLHSTRTKLVFGTGAEDAPLMFVGEAPGADEDRLGEPFVGRAGELLDKMIEAMGWTRHTVYIANILKSRPPGNRNPEPDEVAACFPFLERQIEAIAPRIIVSLGRPASNGLLGNDMPISALRGRFHDRRGVRVMPTFHPAFLLRTPERKRDAWNDLKLVMAELDRLGIAARR
jgi:DNA polymerase